MLTLNDTFRIKQKLSYTTCIAYFVGHISQGSAMSRWLVDVLSPQSPAFESRLTGVGFMVDGVAF